VWLCICLCVSALSVCVFYLMIEEAACYFNLNGYHRDGRCIRDAHANHRCGGVG